MGPKHDLSHVVARFWGHHGHDRPGSDWEDPAFRERQTSGELFWINTRSGIERNKIPGERHHQGRTQGTALRNGGSCTDGGEVRSAQESPVPGEAEAHALQPGHCDGGTAIAGAGLDYITGHRLPGDPSEADGERDPHTSSITHQPPCPGETLTDSQAHWTRDRCDLASRLT